MKKILTILLGLQLMLSFALGSSVSAKVEDTNIINGESVELVLEVVGEDVVFPILQKIGDYPIESLSSVTKSAYKVINNQSSNEMVEQLIILFTPIKDMIIPSFKIEVEGEILYTNPIELTISNSSAPTSSAKFNLAMSQTKDEVFVGEPLLLSIYFSVKDGIDIMDFRSQQPQLTDFIVKEIKGDKSYKKDNYLVHEFRYLITPTKEGNITISSIQAKVGERSRVRDNFFGTFFDKAKWSQITSNSLLLSVKPIPQQSNLIGDFIISEKIDAKEVKSNKPVNFAIGISGEGNLEDFDGINYEIDGVTIYSDDAKITTKLVGSKMVSHYEKKFVFISDHNFTIPTINLSSFNYKTQKIKNLNISSYQIVVKGGAKTTPITIQSATPTQITPDQLPTTNKNEIELWMLLASFILGVLSTLGVIKFLPYLRLKYTPNPMREDQALKLLYPYTNDSKEVEEMVRKLYAKKSGDINIDIDKIELKRLVTKYIQG